MKPTIFEIVLMVIIGAISVPLIIYDYLSHTIDGSLSAHGAFRKTFSQIP